MSDTHLVYILVSVDQSDGQLKYWSLSRTSELDICGCLFLHIVGLKKV
jgi:hypothetical protein